LRNHVLSGSSSSSHSGLVLLRRQGVAAWVARRSVCTASVQPAAVPEPLATAPLPSGGFHRAEGDVVLDDGRVLAHVGTRLDASGRVSTPGVYLGDERVELVLEQALSPLGNSSFRSFEEVVRLTVVVDGAGERALEAD